ncbi:MAG: TRAP transporter small permease [Pseudomonadota bacterium]
MTAKTGTVFEWVWPTSFVVAAGWTIWHLPAYVLDFAPHSNPSQFDQVSAIHARKDVTPDLPGLFGGFADPIDWLALVLLPVFVFLGIRTVRVASMELQDFHRVDKFSIFIGRATMILILGMTLIMLYEVFLRYVVEAPTLWANELTLWTAGFVFLCSGLYAMQQRSHIRIFLLYDVVPRPIQRLFDTIWTALIVIFAFFLVFGSYQQVFEVKFYRWEMFGTAFDPPIPATIQPMILIIAVLISLQAVSNLICDWNAAPTTHSAADDVDESELKAISRTLEDK